MSKKDKKKSFTKKETNIGFLVLSFIFFLNDNLALGAVFFALGAAALKGDSE